MNPFILVGLFRQGVSPSGGLYLHRAESHWHKSMPWVWVKPTITVLKQSKAYWP